MTSIDQSFLELTRPDPVTGELIPIPARERVDRILSHPFARDIIRSMDPQSLYDLIDEAGMNDAYELVLLSSPQQIQSFLDLSAWRKDVFDLDNFTSWMDVLLQAEDSDFDRLITELDREALAIWIREQVAIFEWEQDRDLLDTIADPVSSSPDGVYALVFPEDERSGAQIRLVMERLYAYDLEFALHVLEAVRWELTSDMMEHMYRKRNARLNDLGFVPFEDAIEVYALLDPLKWAEGARKKLAEPIAPSTTTVGALPPVDHQLQSIERRLHSDGPKAFATALASISALVGQDDVAAQADRILAQFRAVANRVHIADLSSSGDTSAARKAVERAQNHLGIGLELVAPGSTEDQARALLQLPLKEIHRAGFSTVANLRHQARQLTLRGNLTLVDTSPYSLLESEDEEMMRGLDQPRPVMHRGKGTPFTSLASIQTVATRLGKIAFAELLFFAWLGVDREQLASGEGVLNGPETITFRTLFATIVLHRLVGNELSLSPHSPDEMRRTLREAHANRQFFDTVIDASQSVIEELAPEQTELTAFARSFVEEYSTWLAIALENVPPDSEDDRLASLALVSNGATVEE